VQQRAYFSIKRPRRSGIRARPFICRLQNSQQYRSNAAPAVLVCRWNYGFGDGSTGTNASYCLDGDTIVARAYTENSQLSIRDIVVRPFSRQSTTKSPVRKWQILELTCFSKNWPRGSELAGTEIADRASMAKWTCDSLVLLGCGRVALGSACLFSASDWRCLRSEPMTLFPHPPGGRGEGGRPAPESAERSVGICCTALVTSCPTVLQVLTASDLETPSLDRAKMQLTLITARLLMLRSRHFPWR
jgi:hypothetical protein